MRDGIRQLQNFSLHCELQAPYTIASDIAALASQFSDTNFVLTHMGFPSEDGHLDDWQKQIAPLQECANVFIKISAIQMLFERQFDKVLAILGVALDVFCENRLLFGSNLPVEYSRCTDFEATKAFLFQVQDNYPEIAPAIFRDNARRLYQL